MATFLSTPRSMTESLTFPRGVTRQTSCRAEIMGPLSAGHRRGTRYTPLPPFFSAFSLFAVSSRVIIPRLARKHMSSPFALSPPCPARTAVDIINPDPRCNAISSHCARGGPVMKLNSHCSPRFRCAPLALIPFPGANREVIAGQERRRNQFANVSGRSCVFSVVSLLSFSQPFSLPFFSGQPRTARGNATSDPQHEYSGEGARRGGEGRRKGL